MSEISSLVLEIDSKGVVKASGNLDVFSKNAEQAAKSATKLEKQNKKSNSSFLSSVVSGNLLADAISNVSGRFVDFTKSSIQAVADYETIEANLAVVLGSAQEASIAFADLKKLGAETPFSVEGLADAAVQLKQTGTSMREMNDVLRMLGDTAGGSNDKFNRLVANYAQIQSVGMTTAMDIKQFAMMGLPIYETLRKIGVEGNATAEQIKEAFKIMTSEGGAFFNGMEIGSKTLNGLFSTIQDNLKSFKVGLMEAFNLDEATKEFFNFIIDRLDAANSILDEYNRQKDVAARLESGTASVQDQIEQMNKTIKVTLVEYNKILSVIKYYKDNYGVINNEHLNELAYIEDSLNYYQKQLRQLELLNAETQLRAENEERVNEIISQSEKQYQEVSKQLQESYEKTDQGRIDAINKQIKMYQEMLDMKKKEKMVDESGFSYAVDVSAFNDEQKQQIKAVLDMLENSLDSLNDKVGRYKRTWQEVFEEITGVTKETFSGSGKLAGELFIESLKKQMQSEQEFSLVKLLGIDRFNAGNSIADIEKNIKLPLKGLLEQSDFSYIEAYTNQIEILDQAIVALLSDTSITEGEQFKWIDNAIQVITKYREELETKLVNSQIAQINKELDEQINLIGKNEQELRRIELAEQKIVGYEAEQIIAKEEKLERLRQEYELAQQISDLYASGDYQGALSLQYENAISKGNYGQAAGYGIAGVAAEATSGSDVGNFISGFSKGGVWGGIIETLIGALGNAIGGMEGLNYALSPITELFKGLSPVLKASLAPAALLSTLLKMLGEGISWLLNVLTFGAVNEMADFYDTMVGLNEEEENQLELLKELNEQLEDVNSAMKEAEEYYLEQRRNLNAEYLNQLAAYKVNDMILTPQGNFSTHPDDYIIATKNPAALGNSGSVVNVKVYNEMGRDANVSVKNTTGSDGLPELLVSISRKVASDFASGVNGWKTAVAAQQSKQSGRRLSI